MLNQEKLDNVKARSLKTSRAREYSVFLLLLFSISWTQVAFAEGEKWSAVPSLSIVYGPEAYALGLKLGVVAKKSIYTAGGYVIFGMVPVGGSIGLTGGLEYSPIAVDGNVTLVGWMSERLNSDSNILLVNLNPKFRLNLPEIKDGDSSVGPFISVGPSFLNPEEWYVDGVNLKFLGQLWNFEAGLRMY